MKLRDFGYTNSDSLSVYGILTGMVFSTILFPCVLSNSLSVMLLPAISEANSRNRMDLIKKSSPEDDTIVCHPWTKRVLGFCSAELDRHSPVPQCFGRTLCPTLSWICPFLFLAPCCAAFCMVWETDTHNADQLVRSHTPHWLYFCWYSTDRSVCLSMGYACQSDFDLRSGTYQPA